MSGEAIGWVFRYSPMRGVAFKVHVALGDSANDAHANEIWASVGYIAKKARTDRKSAGEALAELCDVGLLVLLEERPGGTNRYALVFPDGLSEIVPRVRAQASPRAGTALTRLRAQAPGGAGTGLTNPIEPNGEPNLSEGASKPPPDVSASHSTKDFIARYVNWYQEAHGTRPWKSYIDRLAKQLSTSEAKECSTAEIENAVYCIAKEGKRPNVLLDVIGDYRREVAS